MDTELARTFLAVVATGNFISAADRLHVTQSTVSARIHALERTLGCILFVRNRGGTTLTAAGRQFQKHASTLVRTVEQARHDVGVAKGFGASLRIGGRFGLWEQFLTRCLPVILDTVQRVSVRAEVGFEAELMQGLVQGRLDIAVMYTPESRPGLKVEPLFDERLVLVSTDPEARPEPGPGYVLVDWGPEFFARHAASFPDFFGTALTANIGWLGLQHVVEYGGAGYFPIRLVRSYLRDGRLAILPSAPDFVLSAYMVYPVDADAETVQPALDVIRRAAVSEKLLADVRTT